MKQVQLLGLTPEENNQPIFDYFDKQFDELKKFYQPKEPTKYLTRLEVTKLLKVSLVTLNKWNKNGKLKAFGIGGRVLYRYEDIENSIIKL